MNRIGIATSTLKLAAWLTLWSAAAWCVLGLHDAHFAQEHSICGPWGCGPTIPALVAAHGFWLVLLIPSAYWAARKLDRRRAVMAGCGFVAFGVLGCSTMVLIELLNSFEPTRFEPRPYTPQRILFALATTVEVPLFPGAVAGLVLLQVSRSRHSRRLRQSEDLGGDCDDTSCARPVSSPNVRLRPRIEVGKPLPELTLVDSDGNSIVVPRAANRVGLLLYFMRAAGCSICRGHVQSLVRMAGEFASAGTEVIIVHPGDPEGSRSLAMSLPSPFLVASGGESRTYKAVGLSAGSFGFVWGSGTILVDDQGIVRHARLASLPFHAFSEAEILIALNDLAARSATKVVSIS